MFDDWNSKTFIQKPLRKNKINQKVFKKTVPVFEKNWKLFFYKLKESAMIEHR